MSRVQTVAELGDLYSYFNV